MRVEKRDPAEAMAEEAAEEEDTVEEATAGGEAGEATEEGAAMTKVEEALNVIGDLLPSRRVRR